MEQLLYHIMTHNHYFLEDINMIIILLLNIDDINYAHIFSQKIKILKNWEKIEFYNSMDKIVKNK